MTGTTATPRPGGELPSALDALEAIIRRIGDASPMICLDYDGTLTPLQPSPELAHLPRATAVLLRGLARRRPVAVISGRALADIRRMVGIDGIYYAGNHGYEIEGPDHSGLKHTVGDTYLENISAAHQELSGLQATFPGMLLENKVYSLSLHYRGVAPDRHGALHEAISSVARRHPRLSRHEGKMVVELRPAERWHKGEALRHIEEFVAAETGPVVPLFIGDDVTDEDAFALIRGRGIGIRVGDGGHLTLADYRLENPEEVAAFLARLDQAIPPATGG